MLLYSSFLLIFEFSSIILYCECAPSNKLNEIKNDISKLGTTIEDFAFHVVQDIVEDVAPIDDYEESGNDETGTGNATEATLPDSTTVEKREKRATMSESECLQRCKPKDHIAEEHIDDLKSEVRKLQELVEIMNEQQDIAKSIDSSEKSTFKEPREELLQIKIDLKHAVKGLNDTKVILNAQKKKSEMLERELMTQKLELEKLRFAFINKSDDLVGANIVGASPDFPELSKLLKTISDDETDTTSDSDEIQSRMKDLEQQLQKRKRRQSLSKILKALEDKLRLSEKDDDGLLIRVEKLIKNERNETPPEGRDLGRDGDTSNLDDLKTMIEKLKPKEESRQQPPEHNRQQLSPFPQGSNSSPYLCLVENNGPNNFNFRKFYGPAIDRTNVKVVTPDAPEPSYSGPQANSYSPNEEKPPAYQPQAVVPQVYQTDSSATYKEDLRKQIDALQNAINNLNRPEYVRKPEDKAVINSLEYQVSDLRNILNNQGGQGSASYQYPEQQYRSSRIKRELNEDEEMFDKMTEFLGKILHEDVRSNSDTNELNDLQEKIDEIKKQLDGSTDSKLRSTGVDYPNMHQSYQPQPKNHLAKKPDFFSAILGKIIDKIITSIPVIVSKLFNFSFEELSSYGYDNDGYEMQNIFKNLGVFGYLPVILLRLISGFQSVVRVLKKSEFFRKFLLPVVVLLVVAGAVLFLIWWLQPDDDLNNNNYIAYDNGYSNYTTSRPVTPVSVNYPVYNRSYYNK